MTKSLKNKVRIMTTVSKSQLWKVKIDINRSKFEILRHKVIIVRWKW